LTDDDGVIKKDWNVGGNENLDGQILKEEALMPGEQICVVGKYSTKRSGVEPPPASDGGMIRIYVGDRNQILSDLRKKVYGYLFGMLFFGVAANWITWLVLQHREATIVKQDTQSIVIESLVSRA